MGGIASDSYNYLSKRIWYYCMNRRVRLSEVHITGKDNGTDDYMSRLQNESTTFYWLAATVFQRSLEVFCCKP